MATRIDTISPSYIGEKIILYPSGTLLFMYGKRGCPLISCNIIQDGTFRPWTGFIDGPDGLLGYPNAPFCLPPDVSPRITTNNSRK
jgi:hypothetical protein